RRDLYCSEQSIDMAFKIVAPEAGLEALLICVDGECRYTDRISEQLAALPADRDCRLGSLTSLDCSNHACYLLLQHFCTTRASVTYKKGTQRPKRWETRTGGP